jgi:uncharacterized protein
MEQIPLPENNHLTKFLNLEYGIIGRTASTKSEPNRSSEFHFWVADKDEAIGKIEIGNIIAAFSDEGGDISFGIVTEMRSYSDVDSFIADFLSHNFGEADIQVPTDVSEVIVVTCAVMRNVSAKTKPVDRSRVYFPSELGIQFSYGIVDEGGNYIFKGAPIPIGIFSNGDGTISNISVDEDFLIGPEGAHLNVSGISGLASKTSAILFELKSLLTHSAKNIAVVMFNVKSKDLLYVDQSNIDLQVVDDLAKWSIEAYKKLEIPAEPFKDAKFFAPANPRNPNGTQSKRLLVTNRFTWDLSMIYKDIPTLFDPMDYDDKMEGVWYVIQDKIERDELITYEQVLRWIEQELNRANSSRPPQLYLLGHHVLTWAKMKSHLQRFPQSFNGLIATAGKGVDIPWKDLDSKGVYVIDISPINDRGQRLVFGRAIREINDLLESDDCKLDAVVVYVDELNKFAPSSNIRTPLKSHLINVTARGRSVGLVLFGAEQFASSVDKEIIENSSTYLFGRTESNELRAPNYSGFSNEVKTKLMMLPQGNLLAKFAKFQQPIFVRFPLPPCLPGDKFVAPENKGDQ